MTYKRGAPILYLVQGFFTGLQRKVASLFHLKNHHHPSSPIQPESGKQHKRGMAGNHDSSARPRAGSPLRWPLGQAVGSTGSCLWEMGVSEEGRCLLTRIIGKGALGTPRPSLESHKRWWPQSLVPSTKPGRPLGQKSWNINSALGH